MDIPSRAKAVLTRLLKKIDSGDVVAPEGANIHYVVYVSLAELEWKRSQTTELQDTNILINAALQSAIPDKAIPYNLTLDKNAQKVPLQFRITFHDERELQDFSRRAKDTLKPGAGVPSIEELHTLMQQGVKKAM